MKIITNPPKKIINELLNLYSRGQLDSVVKRTIELIEHYPNSFILWNLNGVAKKGLGQIVDASYSFKKVVELEPSFADGYNNLGVSLKDLGKIIEAINLFKKAISIKPNYAEAYNNLGNSYRDKDLFDKAEKAYQKAIFYNINYTDAYNNCGVVLQEQGKLDLAIYQFEKALSIKPNYFQAYYNLGNIFRKLNKQDEAIKFYKKTLIINPNYVEAYLNIGVSLKEKGKINDALIFFNKAISIKPNFAEAYYNIGIAQIDKNNIEAAIEAYKKAVFIKNDYTDAIYNLGVAYNKLGKIDKAIDKFDNISKDDASFEKALAQKLLLLATICEWDEINKYKDIISTLGTTNQFVSPFAVLVFDNCPKRNMIRSEIYSKINFNQKQIFNFKKPAQIPKRLRIGYFSSDFYDHATMYLLNKVLKMHNAKEFEIFIYDYTKTNNDNVIKNSIRNKVYAYRSVKDNTDMEIANIVHKDNIDIAIDLKGYTKDARIGIFAYRVAPIQINFLGFPGTTGTNFIDYIIADKTVIPEEEKQYYSEEIIYLPNSYQPNDNSRLISDKKFYKKDMDLPKNSFVFCCFNNNYKISSKEFDIWMNLLNRIEGSVIWLLKSNDWSKGNLINEAEKRGVNSNRLVFAEQLPHAEHLARLKLADLFLDTFNVNAHTTASDALWAGLPVITMIGKGFPSRVAASLLNAIGFPELITQNYYEYEELIYKLANEPNELSKIKQKLKKNRITEPLFNTEQYTENLEKCYKKAYEDYFYGNEKKTIII